MTVILNACVKFEVLGGNYEERYSLGCDTMKYGSLSMFARNVQPTSYGSKNMTGSNQQTD